MKADDATLPAELLRKLLRYDPETGELFWRKRMPDLFTGGHRTAEGNCNLWNANFADQPALTAPDAKGYLKGALLGFRVKRHRVIWAMVTGRWPTHHIDHIDGDPSNNRFANLRDVTNAENHRNVKFPRNNTSGYCGVRQSPSGKWSARIKLERRELSLGSYPTKAEAIAARKGALRALKFHPNHGHMRADEVLRPPLGAVA